MSDNIIDIDPSLRNSRETISIIYDRLAEIGPENLQGAFVILRYNDSLDEELKTDNIIFGYDMALGRHIQLLEKHFAEEAFYGNYDDEVYE